MGTGKLCQSFLDVAVWGGELVDQPLCKPLSSLPPDAGGVMKEPAWLYREMGHRNPELVARASGSSGRMLPTGFRLKTVVLGWLRTRPVNAWQGYCEAVSSARASPTLRKCFFSPNCLSIEIASCKCGFRQ